MKWLLSFLHLLMPCAFLVPCAAAQSVSLPTTTTDVVETTEDTLQDLSDPVQDVSEPGSLGDSTDGLTETGSRTEQGATGAVGAGSTALPGKAFRSRLDRLPLRLERLLERIELGRNVRANLRRLERALASASPRERARLLRLLNAEIRRLRAGGVSPAERKRIKRLLRARATVTELGARTPSSGVADATTGAPTPAGTSATAGTSPIAGTAGTGSRAGSGVLGASVAGSERLSQREAAVPPRGGAGRGPGPSGIRDGGAFPLLEVLVALAIVLAVVAGGLAVKEERAA